MAIIKLELLSKSPVFSGAFYLAAALLLMAAVTVVAGNVNPWMFPLVMTATYVGLTLVGALQLRNDGRLSEANFLQLVELAMKRVLLPVMRPAKHTASGAKSLTVAVEDQPKQDIQEKQDT